MDRGRIILAGATGDLGSRIAKELSRRGAPVRLLIRPNSSSTKLDQLRSPTTEFTPVDFTDRQALTRACNGGSVVISTLSGLRPVIVDVQMQLLQAAVDAGVPRFIPSDFAIDFTKIPDGWNRNLNLREEFRKRIDAAPIRPTSILNGAFLEMLTGTAPFILFGIRRILCWGDPDQLMDWTTMDDTARYTASAALDPETPRFLRIAGDQISARTLAATMTELTGRPYKLLRPGSPATLQTLISLTRFLTPASDDLYPAWQGMQYMHNMYAGIAKFPALDNDRYPMRWTTAHEILRQHLHTRPAQS